MLPSAQPDPAAVPPPRAGFSLPLDMIVSPGRGLVKIARTSEWLPAFAVIAACGLGALYLEHPALAHLNAVKPDTVTDLPTLLFATFFAPLSTGVMVAMVFTVFGGGREPRALFLRYFALTMNCLVPSFMGDIAHAAAVALRPPQDYATLADFTRALPDNLGFFASNERELAFLQSFNVFDAWSFVLLAFGISLFGNIRFSWAISIAAIFYFVFAYI